MGVVVLGGGAERREKITKRRIVVLVYNKQKEMKMRRAEGWRGSGARLGGGGEMKAETGGESLQT